MAPASDIAAEREAYQGVNRWVTLAGLWLAYGAFGMTIGGMPPLIGPISEDLNLTRSAMGSILGAWPLVYIAMAIPAGAMIDRFGLRRSLAAGIVFIALSGLLRATAGSYATIFLAVAVFGLGGPFISIGAPKLIATLFSRQDRGTAMGIYMTSIPVGQIAALATANSVLMPLYHSSWRLTLVTYAGVAFLAAAAWWALTRDLRHPDSKARAPDTSFASSLRVFPQLVRTRVVQIVLLMAIGSFLFSHAFNNWLPEILRAGGMTAAAAGLWAALPVVVGIGTTLVIPRLAAPDRRIPMLVGIYLAAGTAALLVGTTTGAPLTVGLLLQGAAGRGVLPIIMLILMDAPQVGSSRMGAAGGLYFTAGEVGGVLGPLLMGIVADLTGGFLGGLLMLTAICAVLASLTVALGFALRDRSRETI